ncbi:MAG: glucosylglycerol-phosphate synthase [Deltaproteobacteria bacterium]|nr:glucosylglycerol-phosphate synthase [Deltaproteobacteria bacterium]
MILATDLDGTFLQPELRGSSSELYKFIGDYREKIVLIFVTGRGYEGILHLLDDFTLPTPDYIIGDVGATVLKMHQNGFTPVMPLQSEIAEKWIGHEIVLSKVRGMDGLKLQDVPQERRCSFFYENSEVPSEVEGLGKTLGVNIIHSADRYLDFLPLGVSKGDSLKRLIKAENLPEERVMVAGDTLNDLSLMQTGYKGVVVANAEKALKEAVSSEKRIYLAGEDGPSGILEAIRYFDFNRDIGTVEKIPEQTCGEADLVIVYHRQPFEEVKKGKVYTRMRPSSPNGIIPTLLDFFSRGEKGAWVAWSQQDSRNPPRFEIDVEVDREKYPHLTASRVALTANDVNIFYKKFSKESFWPIIFSFPERASFSEDHWAHFCEVNRLFAERAAAVSAHNATVWIHDYNLWMTPAYLRDMRPDVKIAFFHHTAFPCADLFNIIPWRRDIVASLLKCDYVGFHIPRYVENFIDIVRSNVPVEIMEKDVCAPEYLTYGCALGVEEVTRKIRTPYGVAGVGAHPVGVDNAKIKGIVKGRKTQESVDSLLHEIKGRKLILSVERLDYVKGPIEKMLAYESFLDQYPEWHEKVAVMNIVTPATPGMEIYRSTREKLDQVVGRINGRFSRMGWTPVRYFYRSVPFEELISFYVAADIAWITPLRDGLNLVSKEYISAKAASDTVGTLILSEFAGAAVELKGAILTNPYDKNSMVQSLASAIKLSKEEIEFRMIDLARRVKGYDLKTWGKDFLSFRDSLEKKPDCRIENRITGC